MDERLAEVRGFWNDVAEGWRLQVGEEGDVNRRYCSDPVLWELLGDVTGRRILDAGCGTGYLTKKLTDLGAHVVGVDLSERMVDLARETHPDLDFRVDSVERLDTLGDASFDALVANYVLMDSPHLLEAVRAIHRVLVSGGMAVVVISHPCFPQGRRTESDDGTEICYTWDFNYFESGRRIDPPWGHFDRTFIWFHRPLSEYWKAFTEAGLVVERFEEPRAGADVLSTIQSERLRRKLSTRPYSVAFRLRKRTR